MINKFETNGPPKDGPLPEQTSVGFELGPLDHHLPKMFMKITYYEMSFDYRATEAHWKKSLVPLQQVEGDEGCIRPRGKLLRL